MAWGLLIYLTHAGIVVYQSGLAWPIYILGGSSPTIMAYVTVALTKSEGSLKEFNSRVFKFKESLKHYLFAILVPVVLGAGGLAAAYMLPGGEATVQLVPFYLFIPYLLSSIIFGGIEELGWRGVLQHDVGKRFNLFQTNLIVGLIWSIWHLPLFFIAGSNHIGNVFLFYLLAGLGFSAFMTWLYAKTQSIALCVFLHASINAAATLGFFVPMSDTPGYIYYASFIFLAGTGFLLIAASRSAGRN